MKKLVKMNLVKTVEKYYISDTMGKNKGKLAKFEFISNKGFSKLKFQHLRKLYNGKLFFLFMKVKILDN